MEAGEVSGVTHRYKAVTFSEPFDEVPVVMVSQVSQNEETPTTVLVTSVSTTKFLVKLQEAESDDNEHIGETLTYMAFEPGAGMIDGKKVIVGKSDRSISDEWTDLDFASIPTGLNAADQEFSSPPLFFAMAQTAYGSEPAVVRYESLTADGVRVRLQEEQSMDTETDHPNQILGYILRESSNACGCTNPISSVSYTIVSDGSCNASNQSIALAISGGNLPLTYDMGQGPTALPAGNIITGLGVGDHSITITDNDGCSYNFDVSLDPPSTDVEIAIGDADCEGGLYSLTGLPTGASPFSYSWSDGSSSQSLNDVGSGTYSLTITDANGCTATTSSNVSTCSASASFSDLVVTERAGCFYNLSFTQLPGSVNITNYFWSLSNGVDQQTGVGQTSIDALIVDAGTHTLVLNYIDENGCCGRTQFQFTTTCIDEDPLPCDYFVCLDCSSGGSPHVTGFVINGVNILSKTYCLYSTSLCVDGSSSLGALVADINAYLQAHTDSGYAVLDNVPLSECRSQVLRLYNTPLSVEYIGGHNPTPFKCDFRPCTDTDITMNIKGSSEDDGLSLSFRSSKTSEDLESFRFYPNPAMNKLVLDKSYTKLDEVSINIFDMQGRIVQKEMILQQNILELDVSEWTRGIYLLKVQSKDDVSLKKLIIQ